MMRTWWANRARSFERRIREAGPGAHVAEMVRSREVARLGERLFDPARPLAWCGPLAPFELLAARGVTACYPEFVVGLLASLGGVEPALERAEAIGWPAESCGFHRAVAGAEALGMVPDPAVVITTAGPCLGGAILTSDLARRRALPWFVLELPDTDDDRARDFVVARLRELDAFLTRHLGPADPEALALAAERSNEARALLAEVAELALARPSPARPRQLANLGPVVLPLLGTEAAVELARAFRDELARDREAGVAGVEPERFRLAWLQGRIQYRQGVEDALAEAGAALVFDELNDLSAARIDPEDPWPGLARRILDAHALGPLDRRARRLVELCRRGGVDGAISPCHPGCHQRTGAHALLSRKLARAGIPTLHLDVDCVDRRSFGGSTVLDRLDAFLELLAAGPEARP